MGTQQSSQIDVNTTQHIAIDSIIPNPRQPRRIFNDDDPKLLELSISIKEHGLIQPIIVARLDKIDSAEEPKKTADSWFNDDPQSQMVSRAAPLSVIQNQIIAGERRWRASRMAGLNKKAAGV